MSESELEAELRALRPARPSLNLEMAIARELELEAEPHALAVRPTAGIIVRPGDRGGFSLWRGFGWALAGAVATYAILGLVPALTRHGAPGVTTAPVAAPAATAYFEPAESAREVISTDQSEIIYDGDDGPTQLVRYSSVERHRWTNPATGALVEVEVPREDVFLVPVAYQ